MSPLKIRKLTIQVYILSFVLFARFVFAFASQHEWHKSLVL